MDTVDKDFKKVQCINCENVVEVEASYEPEYCCNGYMCGCYGDPINPIFCDDCEKKLFEKKV